MKTYFLLLALITSLEVYAQESFIMLDSKNTIIVSIGDIDTRLSPCSTFKIALSLMGYDMNILINEDTPQWDFQDEYNETPASWMKYSYVWYSQLLTPLIGKERIQAYLAQFDYGNQDMSGDPGKNNGLTHAWLSSSLKISLHEQALFLQKIIRYELPVSRHALDMTKNLMVSKQLEHGWKLFGKTGLGTMDTPEGTFELGWLIGWIEKNNTCYPFAFAIQDTTVVLSERIIRVKQLLHKYFFTKLTQS